MQIYSFGFVKDDFETRFDQEFEQNRLMISTNRTTQKPKTGDC